MPRVFISYRRTDAQYVSSMIYEKLSGRFGEDNVFIDVDNIPIGVDFRKHLDAAVGRCDVLIVVIGEQWLNVKSETGERRLDDPADFVRIEITSALQRGIHVVPVLVGNAAMPREQDLPEALRDLAYRNAAELRAGRDLKQHIERLIRGLELLDGDTAAAAPTTEPSPPSEPPVEPEPTVSRAEPDAASEPDAAPPAPTPEPDPPQSAAPREDGRRHSDRRQSDRRTDARRTTGVTETTEEAHIADAAAPATRPAPTAVAPPRTRLAIAGIGVAIVTGIVYTLISTRVYGFSGDGPLMLLIAIGLGVVSALLTRHVVLAPLSCVAFMLTWLVFHDLDEGFEADQSSLVLVASVILAIPAWLTVFVLRWRARRLAKGPDRKRTPVERAVAYVFDATPPRRTRLALSLLTFSIAVSVALGYAAIEDDDFVVLLCAVGIVTALVSAITTRHVVLAPLTLWLGVTVAAMTWRIVDGRHSVVDEPAIVSAAVTLAGLAVFGVALAMHRRAKRKALTPRYTEPRLRWVLGTVAALVVSSGVAIAVLRSVYLNTKITESRQHLKVIYNAIQLYDTQNGHLPASLNDIATTPGHDYIPTYLFEYLLSDYEMRRTSTWRPADTPPRPALRPVSIDELPQPATTPLVWDYSTFDGQNCNVLTADGEIRITDKGDLYVRLIDDVIDMLASHFAQVEPLPEATRSEAPAK
ncbi:MAG: TIR domain-containing protein [Phycisphaera sp.]|nr:TIR domain-containing protein [Phycisphaera sp.]